MIDVTGNETNRTCKGQMKLRYTRLFQAALFIILTVSLVSGCTGSADNEKPKMVEVWKSFTSSDGLPHSHVLSLANFNGRVWVATRNGLVVGTRSGGFVVPQGSEEFLKPGNPVWKVKPYGDMIFFATGGGLVTYSATENKWRKFSQADDIRDVALLNGAYWVARTWGLAVFNGSTWEDVNTKTNSNLAGDVANSIEAFDGKLLIGTNTGVNIVSGGAWKTITGYSKVIQGSMFVKVKGNSELVSNRVLCISKDGAGTLFGTVLGLSHLSADGTVWKTFTADHEEPGTSGDYEKVSGNSPMVGNNVTALFADPDGTRYIGTTSGLSTLTAKGAWVSYTSESGHLPFREVTSIWVDGDDWWIGTKGGLALRTMEPETLKR